MGATRVTGAARPVGQRPQCLFYSQLRPNGLRKIGNYLRKKMRSVPRECYSRFADVAHKINPKNCYGRPRSSALLSITMGCQIKAGTKQMEKCHSLTCRI